MERNRATPSLHQRIEGTLDRGARAHATSLALIADQQRIGGAAREMVAATRARRDAGERAKRSETDKRA